MIKAHTATLHKPHVVTHSRQDFIDTLKVLAISYRDGLVEDGMTPAEAAEHVKAALQQIAGTIE